MAERIKVPGDDASEQDGKTLLFDLDGVLVYSEARNYIYYYDVYDRAQNVYSDPTIRMPSVEEIAECFSLGINDAIEALTPREHADKIPEIIEIAQQTPRYENNLRYPPHIDVVIPELYKSHKLAIVTNAKDDSVEELFRKYPELEQYFDSIVTEAGKPEPEGIIKALEALKSSSSSAALAGDTPHTDGEAARRAKIQFFHVARWKVPAESADLVVSDLYDLYRALDENAVALGGLNTICRSRRQL
jgi:HAD superfamily hydrolase (TIGR01549 family)